MGQLDTRGDRRGGIRRRGGLEVAHRLNALRTQVAFKNEDTLNSLQAKYITPLRAAIVTLSRRMGEIEKKFQEDSYGEVSEWFKVAKDHVVGDERKDDFQKWCYYEGTFALSTIYYTGMYFRCVHDISAHAPFRQLASSYSSDLERQLEGYAMLSIGKTRRTRRRTRTRRRAYGRPSKTCLASAS